jgi:hypothetical protein
VGVGEGSVEGGRVRKKKTTTFAGRGAVSNSF